ncbi:MAG: XrtA system polysaccharide deacetylase [Candidatus Binatia bacterium]
MLNALTIDVEDYFQVEAFADVILPIQWIQYPLRVEQNTRRLLEMLGRHGIRATFFVLGWVAEHCPDLVREIALAGHEIGCHGYNHQRIGRADEKVFREDIYRAKAILEELSGALVRCYRAPSYSVTTQTLWALDILHHAGFEYDSSIFPVFHDQYGIPDAPRFPHYRSLGNGRRILEFPPSTLSIYGANLPISGGGYFRLLPYGLTAWALRRINEKEAQPAMFYLHPWEIDPAQPRIAASWRSRFRHYQNLHSTEEKFDRLLDEFSWASLTEVVRTTLSKTESIDEVANGL